MKACCQITAVLSGVSLVSLTIASLALPSWALLTKDDTSIGLWQTCSDLCESISRYNAFGYHELMKAFLIISAALQFIAGVLPAYVATRNLRATLRVSAGMIFIAGILIATALILFYVYEIQPKQYEFGSSFILSCISACLCGVVAITEVVLSFRVKPDSAGTEINDWY